MKTALSGIFCLLCIALSVKAQNLESIGKQKPLAVTGGVSFNQIFYAVNGIESRRDPYSYYASGNLNLSLYGWSVPLSFSVSNQNTSFQQPDDITWEYPEAMTKVLDVGEVVYGQFFEPGTYEIKLVAQLGECFDEVTKTITVLERTIDDAGGRLGYEKFVKTFELYPNPNHGNFDVRVELSEESPITVSVWSTVTSLNMGVVRDTGKSDYLMHVDFSPLSSGTYVLRLDHAKGHESIRFIVH